MEDSSIPGRAQCERNPWESLTCSRSVGFGVGWHGSVWGKRSIPNVNHSEEGRPHVRATAGHFSPKMTYLERENSDDTRARLQPQQSLIWYSVRSNRSMDCQRCCADASAFLQSIQRQVGVSTPSARRPPLPLGASPRRSDGVALRTILCRAQHQSCTCVTPKKFLRKISIEISSVKCHPGFGNDGG